MRDSTNLYDFAGIGELSEATTQLLALGMLASSNRSQRADVHDRVKHFVVQRARDYLNQVREGFTLSVRTSNVGDRAEIGYLLDRVLTDWTSLSEELGLSVAIDDNDDDDDGFGTSQIERVRGQLLAFGMAATAIGFLPRLPTEQITFPYSYTQPPSYADISPPDSPGEMLRRIEEVEQLLWQVLAGSMEELVRRRYGALRRTYGFFEANALLAGQEVERFGLKRKRPGLTLLS